MCSELRFMFMNSQSGFSRSEGHVGPQVSDALHFLDIVLTSDFLQTDQFKRIFLKLNTEPNADVHRKLC